MDFASFYQGIHRGMVLKTAQNGVVYGEAPQLTKTELVRHGSSTRNGGISKGSYASLNMSWHRTGSVEETRSNILLAAEAMGISVQDLVITNGIHGVDILRMTEENRGQGYYRPYRRGDRTYDGMITDDPTVALNVIHADCSPVFFVDIEKRAIGLCHAGWRGTVHGIVEKMITAMVDTFGTRMPDLLAVVGPNITRKHFQVGQDVIDLINQAFPSDLDFYEKDREAGKYLADLNRLAVYQMFIKGLPAQNITVAELCTYENEELFYSYRRQGWEGGAMNSFLQLKGEENGQGHM